MFVRRTNSIRSGIRKPKPRKMGAVRAIVTAVGYRRALGWGGMCWVWFLSLSPGLWANDGVSFNVPATVPCLPWQEPASLSDSAAIAQRATHLPPVRLASHRSTGTQLIVFVLDVTVIFAEPGRYDSVMFEVVPLSRRGTVVDYAPRTQTTSDWVGEITRESVQQRQQQLNSNLHLGLPGYGSGGMQFNSQSNENTVSRQSLKAPVTAVVTSGISQRGWGVFFRYRTTRESLIEGGQQLHVVLEVPTQWRGDLLQVHCVAHSAGQRVQRSYLSALTMADDPEARDLAEQFAAADHRVEQILARYQVTQRPGNFWTEVEHKLSRRGPSTSPTDPQQVRRSLMAATSSDQIAGFEQLPTTLQAETLKLLDHKRAVLRLAGSHGTDR